MNKLRFLLTSPHPCSYFDDREAATVFVDPDIIVSSEDYSALSLYGFRRSGDYYYRPECSNCSACIPTRIAVDQFVLTRSQKRIKKRNEDLVVLLEKDIENDECYALYEAYINARHKDGDMYPPSYKQYTQFLGKQTDDSRYAFFRDGQDTLIAVAVIDFLAEGLSAVYTFYDPTESQRSLGTFAILWQIECALAQQRPYLYLGYWIDQHPKMHYKVGFSAIEVLTSNGWQKKE